MPLLRGTAVRKAFWFRSRGGSISLRGVRGVFDGLQHGMDYVIGLGCEDIFCLLIYKTMN